MSTASVSSKNEKTPSPELPMEVEAARSLNKYLRTYLNHIKSYKRNMMSYDANLKELRKVNSQWVDVVRMK